MWQAAVAQLVEQSTTDPKFGGLNLAATGTGLIQKNAAMMNSLNFLFLFCSYFYFGFEQDSANFNKNVKNNKKL